MKTRLDRVWWLPALEAYFSAGLTLAVLIWVGIIGWTCSPSHVYIASQCNSIAGLSVPLFTAFLIWLIALAIWQTEKRSVTPGFFWLISVCLASGALSAAGNFTAGRIFNLTLVWLAPLTIGFHLGLLGRPLSIHERTSLYVSLTLAAVWTAPFLAATIPQLQTAGVYFGLRGAVRLTLLVAVATGVTELWRGYRTGLPHPAARRVQLLVFGSALAFAPLLLLSVLPETLKMPVYVPYEFTFPCLLLSPIAYLYAVYRKRLSRTELALQRFVIYFALAIVFLAVYLLTIALMRIPAAYSTRLLIIGVMLSGVMVVIIACLHPELAAVARWSLQGKRTPEVALHSFSEQISLANDRVILEKLLAHDLPSTLGARGIIFLTRQAGISGRNPVISDGTRRTLVCL